MKVVVPQKKKKIKKDYKASDSMQDKIQSTLKKQEQIQS